MALKKTYEYFSKFITLLERLHTEVFIQNFSQRVLKECVKYSSFENDGELMLMVVQATAAMFSVDFTGRARERVALSNKASVCRIRFTN